MDTILNAMCIKNMVLSARMQKIIKLALREDDDITQIWRAVKQKNAKGSNLLNLLNL